MAAMLELKDWCLNVQGRSLDVARYDYPYRQRRV